ncbi:TAP42-like protein [Collybia nuda]|uniref:TAP42-like protein n=1 Tax=Collybia nuda TaxID=64659 RepID=A0A9P5YK56_9AGAR|nr:TAP42-like protein [Collybia nuda]
MSLPLPTLFARSLASASKAFNRPTIEDITQDIIQSSLTDLTTLRSRVVGIALFSPNETLEDIATRDLLYLLIPYVTSEVRGRIRTTEREERILSLGQTQKDIKDFLSNLENYEIVPEDERALHGRRASTIIDAAQRREHKIKQYQKEKDLRARVEAVRKRRGQLPLNSADSPSDFDLISSLLPSPSPKRTPNDDDDEELDSETEDILREATLLLLRLLYAHAHSQLESTVQELELLRNAPPPAVRMSAPEDDRRGKNRKAESDMWKLDVPSRSNSGPDGKGPLLDSAGKPLRPFTILPSDTAERARLQAQVFGPGHRLPTMSIDEYLQIERERGNIITGGGPASEAAPTSSEQLTLDSEMDGTKDGEVKLEEKRLKDEKWARYTDDNPRGAGNTMNRG